jgi:hypothetical protein
MIPGSLAFRSAAALVSVTLRGVALAALGAVAVAVAQNAPAPTQPVPLPQAPVQTLPATPAEPSIPQYQVEVLIFAHRDFDRGEEQFAHENGHAAPIREQELRAPPVFDDSNFGPLAQNPAPGEQPLLGENPQGGDALAADPNEFRFRLLRPEELQLTSQYRVLERNSQAYAPLLHGGWVQPGLPEADARPIDLAMLGARNPMGTIRLYLSRFLHVNLDLSYQDVAAAPVAPSPANELTELPIAPRYRLVDDRRTNSGELHYFDHPAFGVLIKITPVRPEPTSPGTPGTRPAA